MHEDSLKTLKIVVIVAVVIGVLAAIAYIIYGFALFWATFAVGITIGLLLIISLVLLVLAIYLWIRTFLLKREVKRYENILEQTKIELDRCRSKFNQIKIQKSEED
jgi:uncharacterized membrane protein